MMGKRLFFTYYHTFWAAARRHPVIADDAADRVSLFLSLSLSSSEERLINRPTVTDVDINLHIHCVTVTADDGDSTKQPQAVWFKLGGVW